MGSPAAATAPKGGATWRSGPPASLQRRLSSAAASSTDTRASTRPLHIVVTCLPASSRGIVVLPLLDVGRQGECQNHCAATGRLVARRVWRDPRGCRGGSRRVRKCQSPTRTFGESGFILLGGLIS